MILPEAFIEQINNILPTEEAKLFFEALDCPAKISIRRNIRKTDGNIALTDKVKWCDTGYYLPQREAFTFDPKFQSGKYYVQDASSMIIAEAVKRITDNSPLRYLDLCAAPGGKTTPQTSIRLRICGVTSKMLILMQNPRMQKNCGT